MGFYQAKKHSTTHIFIETILKTSNLFQDLQIAKKWFSLSKKTSRATLIKKDMELINQIESFAFKRERPRMKKMKQAKAL